MTYSRKMRWAGHLAHMEQKRNAYRILVGEAERRKPLGRYRHRRKDTIKMNLTETGLGDMDWINLAQVRGE
jgi:hypothetical protein